MPYLNERNVVANVPISDVMWDHPDRETNPLASGPGEVIFSRLSADDQVTVEESTRKNFFKQDAFFDIHSKKKSPERRPPSKSENVFAQETSQTSNYLDMYKAESQKNMILANQNQELRNLLEKKNVGRASSNQENTAMDSSDRQRYETVIDDLRGQNEKLSHLLKNPVETVVRNHVIGNGQRG